VLIGHHNIYGEVFKDLQQLQVGGEIVLYSDRSAYYYEVVERVIFAERFASLEQRLLNTNWVLPTDDERLILITCWPYESNTHRLVLVAKPLLIEN
jgi:sortase A